MKRISKRFESLRQAERHQTRLYGLYGTVRLVSFPRLTESGLYVWEVQQ